MKSKKAWVKIVEAFIAILILSSVLLSLLGFSYFYKDDSTKEVYEIESAILFSIQNNNSYRSYVLDDSLATPLNIDNGNSNIRKINKHINSSIPSYLNCSTFICRFEDDCSLDKIIEKDIFTQLVIISSNITSYNPRKIKMFCWFDN